MKKAIFILIYLFSLSALTQSPDLISCTGENIKIDYTLGKNDILAFLSVKIKDKTYSARGDRLLVSNGGFGEILTMMVGHIPDLKTNYISIVMPTLNLMKEKLKALDFNTMLIEHQKNTSFGGPSLVNGLIDQINHRHDIKCVAIIH